MSRRNTRRFLSADLIPELIALLYIQTDLSTRVWIGASRCISS